MSISKQNPPTAAKSKHETSIDAYVPVNVISVDVRDFIAAFEANWTRANSSDSMDIDESLVPTSLSQNVFEPARYLDDFASPKRFYRTFWRSMTRRILELSI